MKANMDIRQMAKSRSVRLWEIANYLGVSESTVTRCMRTEMNGVEKTKYENAINEISKNHEERRG